MPDGLPRRPTARFATTRWSLVLEAGQTLNLQSTSALASLCEIYWYPVYSFIRRQGVRAEDCGDLTQAFFARVLEKGYFQNLDPARGRFRAFLCASLRHFLSNERDRERALKRGGARPLVSLDVAQAEHQYQLEPRDEATPERLFERRWALILLERVMTELRHEYASTRKRQLFEHLKGALTGADAIAPYADVASALGMTEGAVKVAAYRLRRRFRELLVAEIADTVADRGEIDGEIDYLMRVVCG